MRIAFYAPLKPPDHPVPSGDRRMARLLIQAMELAGHRVELANRLRSRDPEGDAERQARLQAIGQTRAVRLLHRYRKRPADERPELWFTYHVYYKAPDWIGPQVAAGLGIPYLVAEASVAAKRAAGPWDASHQATLAALDQAAGIVALNPADIECLPDPSRARLLRPFLDGAPLIAVAEGRARHRNRLAARHGLDPERPWLVAVAMMRPGDKLASYHLLAQSLQEVADQRWHLLVIGDGPARREVEQAFAALPETSPPRRIVFTGELAEAEVAIHVSACDLMVWPAIGEAYGMALLEAQTLGLPVLAGSAGGVSAIVRDGRTGRLTRPGDAVAFAAALRALLDDPAKRQRMAAEARRVTGAEHSLEAASAALDGMLKQALAASRPATRDQTSTAQILAIET